VKAVLIGLALMVAACGGSPSATPASPSPRTAGPLSDTWTLTRAAWHRSNGSGPTPRYLSSLAYDPPRHDYVLFGGLTAKGVSAETWTWDGTTWTLVHPKHSPRARYSAAFGYDPRYRVALLFGGRVLDQAEDAPDQQTWAWDGTDWTDVTSPARETGAREGASIVTAGGDALLFGGRLANDIYYGDARIWDGHGWARVDQGSGPEGRADAAVAWNPASSSLLVFGGLGLRADVGPGNFGRPLADGWTLKDGVWNKLDATGPPPLAEAGAIWDGARTRITLLFGMACPNPQNDAWAWDGSAWSRSALPVPARWGASVAQDGAGDVLVFGGDDQTGC
jgi:hypothetical protein